MNRVVEELKKVGVSILPRSMVISLGLDRFRP